MADSVRKLNTNNIQPYILVEPFILNSYNYLPKIFQNRQVMRFAMDALNVLVSKERDPFVQIRQAYFDTLYKNSGYEYLSYPAKLAIINDLGFDYLVDVIEASLGKDITTEAMNERITQLLGFFELIYSLKSKREGLYLVFNLLGLDFTYTTWDEMDPKGEPFTATLTVTASPDELNENSNQQQEANLFVTTDDIYAKLKKFVRAYMLPWITVVVEMSIYGGSLYLMPLAAFVDGMKSYYKDNEYPSANRQILKVGIYDVDNYDDPGVVYDIITTDLPEYDMGTVTLKIVCNIPTAVIKINGVTTDEVTVNKFNVVNYSVSYNGTTKNYTIVCSKDRIVTVNM